MKRQNGNALFLILIAVALFAALSYAITQSGRGGGSIEKEQAQLQAAQLTQFTAQYQSATQKMMTLNNCTETQLSFAHASWGHTGYDNATSPTDERCHYFSENGGGLDPTDFPSNITSEIVFTGRTSIDGLGRSPGSSGNTYSSELLMVLRGLSYADCLAMNQGVGLVDPTPAVDPIYTNMFGSNDGYFNSDFNHQNRIGSSYGGAANLDGQTAGCFQASYSGGTLEYVGFLALIAR